LGLRDRGRRVDAAFDHLDPRGASLTYGPMTKYTLGMVLSRPVETGIGTHFGVVVAVEPEVRVVENQKFVGIQEVSLRDFANGSPLKVESIPAAYEPDEIAFRARWLVGKVPYQLVNWNCETLVRYVLTDKAESVQSTIGSGAVATLVLATEAYTFGEAALKVINDKPILPEIPRMPGAQIRRLRRLLLAVRAWEVKHGRPCPFVKRTQRNRIKAA
jgi:hypothetical protein